MPISFSWPKAPADNRSARSLRGSNPRFFMAASHSPRAFGRPWRYPCWSTVRRAMLYGACRSNAPFGGRAADLMVGAAGRLARELRIRDEVDRRMRLLESDQRQTGCRRRLQRADPRGTCRTAQPGRHRQHAPARTPARAGRSTGGRPERRQRPRRCTPVGTRTRRTGPGRPGMHQCAGRTTAFAQARDREELSAQRRHQAGQPQPARSGVQGPSGGPAPLSFVAGLRPAIAAMPGAAPHTARRPR